MSTPTLKELIAQATPGPWAVTKPEYDLFQALEKYVAHVAALEVAKSGAVEVLEELSQDHRTPWKSKYDAALAALRRINPPSP